MAGLARVVAPGVPHHVTQRGNRRQRVFFGADDCAAYRARLAEGCRAAGVAVGGGCRMPNHAHPIPVPSQADGLRGARRGTPALHDAAFPSKASSLAKNCSMGLKS